MNERCDGYLLGAGKRRMNSSRDMGKVTATPAFLNLMRVRMLPLNSVSVTLPSLSLSTTSHCRSASLGSAADAGVAAVAGVSPAVVAAGAAIVVAAAAVGALAIDSVFATAAAAGPGTTAGVAATTTGTVLMVEGLRDNSSAVKKPS